MFIVPQNWLRKIIITIVAISLGFVVNGIRVILLAVLVAQQNQEAFKYWHDNEGSFVFSTISVIIFGIFCWYLMEQDKKAQSMSQ